MVMQSEVHNHHTHPGSHGHSIPYIDYTDYGVSKTEES